MSAAWLVQRSVPMDDQLEAGDGRCAVRLTWHYHGDDLYVHVGGGQDHIGAAALAGPGDLAAGRVLVIEPHKEGELALTAARRLHAALGVTACVTAGIHLEQITPGEIETVLANVEQAVAALIARLGPRAQSPGACSSAGGEAGGS